MSKELEYIQRQIDIVKQQVEGSNIKLIVTNSVTKHQYDYYKNELQTLENIEQALDRLEAIDNSNPSEALECLEKLKGMEISSMPFSDEYGTQEVDLNDIRKVGSQLNTDFREYTATIKQALLKAQEQEKEKLFFKNIHNTKIKTPLVSIFEGLSKEERYKFTEHLYYHWEEMKEALEDKNNELEKENAELKAKSQKEHKALKIIKEKDVDIYILNHCKTVDEYNSKIVHIIGEIRELDPEEFDILKRC